MGYYNFPHTRNYDTDLGYLIDWFITNKNKIEENTAITIEKALTATEKAIKAANSATSASNSAELALELKNQTETLKNQTEALKNLMQDKIDQIDTNTNRIDNLATIDQGSITTTADAELVDIRVGSNGTTYPSAGDSVRGQVTELKSGLDNIYTISPNLFDKSKVIRGKYANAENGVITEKENAGYCYFSMSVKFGEKYTVSRSDYVLYQCDDIGNVINSNAGAIDKANYTLTPAFENVTKIYVSFRPTNKPIDTYMVVKGEEMPTQYYPYGMIITDDFLKAIKNKKEEIYYVGAHRNYTSFTECIRALKNNTEDKIIYVDGGIYDIYTEMGGDSFIDSITDASNWTEINDIIPPNTHIIGLGNVIFKYYPTKTTSKSVQLISPLNIIDGNVTIENINIDGRDCRYLIHDDGSGDSHNTTHKYINVHLNKIAGGFTQAFGSGIGENCQLIFENCYFKSYHTAFSVHNQWWATNGTIAFNSCILDGSELSCRLGSLSARNTDYPIKVDIMNSYIPTLKYTNEDGNSERTIPYNVTLLRCGNVNINSSDFAENQFPPTIYN